MHECSWMDNNNFAVIKYMLFFKKNVVGFFFFLNIFCSTNNSKHISSNLSDKSSWLYFSQGKKNKENKVAYTYARK